MTYTLLRLALVAGLGVALAALAWRVSRPDADADAEAEAEAGPSRLATLLAALGLLGILFHYADPRFKLDRLIALPTGLWRDLLYAPGALLVGVALAHIPRAPQPPAADAASPEGAPPEAAPPEAAPPEAAPPEAEPGADVERARGVRLAILFLALGYALFLLHDPIFVLATAAENREPGTLDELGEVVMQRNGRNCVAASAASVLRRWGAVDLRDGEVALRAQTSYYGTSEHRIVDAVGAITSELQAWRVKTDWNTLRAMDHPAILGVRLSGTIPHAVALVGLDRESAYLAEPLHGLQRFPLVALPAIKPWDGWAIVIGRDFVHHVAVGERSPLVQRARAALRALGVPDVADQEATDAELLDPLLAEQIAKVQLERGLPPTGALDPPTLLCLAALRGRAPSLTREAQRLIPILAAHAAAKRAGPR